MAFSTKSCILYYSTGFLNNKLWVFPNVIVATIFERIKQKKMVSTAVPVTFLAYLMKVDLLHCCGPWWRVKSFYPFYQQLSLSFFFIGNSLYFVCSCSCHAREEATVIILLQTRSQLLLKRSMPLPRNKVSSSPLFNYWLNLLSFMIFCLWWS